MINGPVVAGLLIALTLVCAAMYAGSWFHSAVEFADAHSLDAARVTRPVVCSFDTEELGGKTTGSIYSRDGLMRFDIRNDTDGAITEWGIEIDMTNPEHMMSRANPTESFVSLESYANLRVKVLEDLKTMLRSDKLHCAPWWSARSFRFALEGRL